MELQVSLLLKAKNILGFFDYIKRVKGKFSGWIFYLL